MTILYEIKININIRYEVINKINSVTCEVYYVTTEENNIANRS